MESKRFFCKVWRMRSVRCFCGPGWAVRDGGDEEDDGDMSEEGLQRTSAYTVHMLQVYPASSQDYCSNGESDLES
eukprot:5282021-Amphidinium_carterae.1